MHMMFRDKSNENLPPTPSTNYQPTKVLISKYARTLTQLFEKCIDFHMVYQHR